MAIRTVHVSMDQEEREKLIKKRLQVVCICKGIPLGKIVPFLKDCQTVEDVNAKTGCGSGGCAGERCGPRLKILLKKQRELEEKSKKS